MMSEGRSHGMSVIVPVGNGSHHLPDVLRALNAQVRRPDELIIVNDRVSDDSLRCLDLLDMEHRVIRTNPESGRCGVSAARNIGAEESSSTILVFLDSDVILPDTYLAELNKRFRSPCQPGECIDGILGLSAVDCRFDNFLSNYKNLWMRFTYQRLKGFVGTLNTSCFAVRRAAFFGTGAFDESRRRDDVEDAILGDRLKKEGYRIVVANDLEYVHKKSYNLRSAIRVDYLRSRKLTEYTVRVFLKREKNPASSIPANYFVGIPLFYLAVAILPFGCLNRNVFLISLLLALASSAVSMNFLSFVRNIKGRRFLAKAFVYQLVVYASSGMGIAAGVFRTIFSGNTGDSRRTACF